MHIDVYSYEGLSIPDAAAEIATQWLASPRSWLVIANTISDAEALQSEFVERGVRVRLSSPIEREDEFQTAVDAAGDCVHVYLLDDRNGSRPIHVEVVLLDRAGNPGTDVRVALLNGADLYLGTPDGAGGWHVLATARREGTGIAEATGVALPDALWQQILDTIDRALRGESIAHGDA